MLWNALFVVYKKQKNDENKGPMKRIIFIITVMFFSGYFYSQEIESNPSASGQEKELSVTSEGSEALEEDVNIQEEAEDLSSQESEVIEAAKPGVSEIPAAKRPLPIDKEKMLEAAQKDESLEDEENYRNTIKFGIPSEISTLIDELMEKDDLRFTEEIYDLFQTTKNSTIREKGLAYFTKLKDPCLEDYAVEILNDPYDQKNELVSAVFKYVSEVETKEAVPAVLTLIESENENYFNAAITALGSIGGPAEALFLAEYLDREDLSDAQRQALMRTCGKMHAVETWDKLVNIFENEDENTFVRMYAAESLGLMQTEKSVPILVERFDSPDPNLRQYIIKGLVNFPDVIEAKSVIIQGIRDEHWKVRQESIRAAKEMKLTDAVDYLIYRVKNDSEKLIKEESVVALVEINTEKGNEFLVSQIKDKKASTATKKKIIAELVKNGSVGEKEILDLAKETLSDDKNKDMRYAIGKELAKHYKSTYDQVALLYLQSKDSTTVGIGLDMYKNGKSKGIQSAVESVAKEKKKSSNKTRARKLLNLPEEEEEEKESKDKKEKTSEKEKSSEKEKTPPAKEGELK